MESQFNNPPSLSPKVLKEVSIPVSVVKFVRIHYLTRRVKSLISYLDPPLNSCDKKLMKHIKTSLKALVTLCNEIHPDL